MHLPIWSGHRKRWIGLKKQRMDEGSLLPFVVLVAVLVIFKAYLGGL